MANNNQIFNAAFNGASGGGANRWISSSDPNSYAAFYTSVNAFATAVDALIAPGVITAGQEDLMRSLCEGVITGRAPSGTHYNEVAAAIVAAWTKGIVSLQPSGGGGGGTIIQVNGIAVPPEPILNLTGPGVTTTDTPGVRTNVDFESLPAEAITSFTHAPSVVLVGTTVTHPAFTATYADAPTTATLTDTEGGNDNVSGTPNAFNSSNVWLKNVYGNTVTATLAVTSPEGAASRNFVETWAQNVRWDVQVDPGVYDSAFIASLVQSVLQLGPQGTFAVNATVGLFTWYATRTAFGVTALNFKVNGLPFAISKVGAAVPFTNANGITENYDVWRSDNPGLGAFSFTES